MGPLYNLKLLKADMEKKGWVIDSFRFPYKGISYIVLVILFKSDESKGKYDLLKLDFLHPDNFKFHLLVPANAGGLQTDAMTLRLFFHIEYDDKNLGDILQQFTMQFGYFIPQSVSTSKTKPEKQAMVCSLSNQDNEEPNKIYCYAVKRNPVAVDRKTNVPRQLMRSNYNDNKARLLRPSLYKKLGSDKTISFCFTDDAGKDYSDEMIVGNWINRQQSAEAFI